MGLPLINFQPKISSDLAGRYFGNGEIHIPANFPDFGMRDGLARRESTHPAEGLQLDKPVVAVALAGAIEIEVLGTGIKNRFLHKQRPTPPVSQPATWIGETNFECTSPHVSLDENELVPQGDMRACDVRIGQRIN